MLLLVFPPVIYTSAFLMSWREFKFNLRPITLLSVGSVVFTTLAVAAAAHWLMDLPWPVGFLLGAIISPPDAIAPLSIARRMELPRRILVILEGEAPGERCDRAYPLSLRRRGHKRRHLLVRPSRRNVCRHSRRRNFMGHRRRLANAPVETMGERSPDRNSALDLNTLPCLLAAGAPGWLRRPRHPSCGALRQLEWPSADKPATRLQGVFFWEFFTYVIEGMVFLITGLQARTVLSRIGDYSFSQLAISVTVITAVVIVARFVWVFPVAYLPRWLFPPIRRKDPSPPWQWPFVLSFTGVRGIVSLAAALAIPFATSSGQPFPYRDLILFLTFSVILITLVGQGLMLPWVIRALGLSHAGHKEREIDRAEELNARSEAVEAAIERLDKLRSGTQSLTGRD